VSDRLIGSLLLAVCGLFYWQTTIVRRPSFAAFEALGAETFPRAVIVLLALFSVVLVVRGRGSLVPRVDRERLIAWLDRYRLPLLSLALFAGYVLAIERVGWIVSTIAFLVVLQLLLRPRRGRELAYVLVGSAAFALALGQVFERVLRVLLPRGTLF
jgi:putative tricarboxylic transport membrane protein